MKIPKLLQNSIAYSVVTVLQKGISFLLLPIYTLYMMPADYGILGVSVSVASFLSIFMTLSLGAAAGRFYYKRKDDEKYIQRLYGTLVTIVLLNSILMGGAFIALHRWIIDPFLGNIDFIPYVLLSLLTAMVSPLYLYFQEYLQTIQDGVYYSVNSIICFVIQVGLSVFFLAVFKWGVLGVLSANLITAIIFFFYALIVFSKRFKWGIDKDIAKDSFNYALPLVPHQLAAWSNGTIDKLIVNGLKSETDAGLYNLGQQYSSVMGIVTNSINHAYVPWFFDKVNYGEEGRKMIKKVAELLICIITFVAIAMSLFGKELLDLMISNPEYDGVWMMIPLLVTGYLFQGLYFFYVNILYLNHPQNVFTITLTTMAINIGLNFLLIPIWGCMGSALVFAITFLIQSIITLIISMKKEKEVRYNWTSMYVICFLGVLFSMPALLLGSMGLFAGIGVKTAILAVFAAIIFFRYKDEFELLKTLIHKS